MVTETTEAVRRVLLDDELTQDEKRDKFQALIRARLDLDKISEMVMVRSWRYFDSDQRRQFKDLFEQYLVQWYWHQVEGEAFKTISVRRDWEDPDRKGYWVVETLITRDGPSKRVELRLRRATDSDGEPADWKIIDMTYGKISEVELNRGQFEDTASRKGPEGVLEQLRNMIKKD